MEDSKDETCDRLPSPLLGSPHLVEAIWVPAPQPGLFRMSRSSDLTFCMR